MAMFPSFNARAVGLTMPAHEAIALASAAGFGGVDLMVRDLVAEGEDPHALRRRMDDLGLRGGAWPLPVAWRGEPAQFAHDLAALPRYAETASILGLTRTGTWVMPETPLRPLADAERDAHFAEVVDLHVDRLGAIARVLHAAGVRLGLEVIGVASSCTGRGYPFVRRLGDLDRWLEPLWREAPNLGILLDGFHVYAAGEAVETGLAWGIERVVWVHVADLPAAAPPDPRTIRDEDRGLPGENGAVDSADLLRSVEEAGYDGPVTAEPMAGCRSLTGLSALETAQRVYTALRTVWPRRRESAENDRDRAALNG